MAEKAVVQVRRFPAYEYARMRYLARFSGLIKQGNFSPDTRDLIVEDTQRLLDLYEKLTRTRPTSLRTYDPPRLYALVWALTPPYKEYCPAYRTLVLRHTAKTQMLWR